ncbi:pheromone-regulated protein prm10 [Mycoemilia scoparia]|uniref:Pheromone-regulated protein prm10 n=1 Tax=Mycoemilia scoparia TaxID=417184 RepID=A0A9W7ZVC0_9FUNG|nr:pheromone-regulated protein prm10 [Mycoemilia scoparia]
MGVGRSQETTVGDSSRSKKNGDNNNGEEPMQGNKNTKGWEASPNSSTDDQMSNIATFPNRCKGIKEELLTSGTTERNHKPVDDGKVIELRPLDSSNRQNDVDNEYPRIEPLKDHSNDELHIICKTSTKIFENSNHSNSNNSNLESQVNPHSDNKQSPTTPLPDFTERKAVQHLGYNNKFHDIPRESSESTQVENNSDATLPKGGGGLLKLNTDLANHCHQVTHDNANVDSNKNQDNKSNKTKRKRLVEFLTFANPSSLNNNNHNNGCSTNISNDSEVLVMPNEKDNNVDRNQVDDQGTGSQRNSPSHHMSSTPGIGYNNKRYSKPGLLSYHLKLGQIKQRRKNAAEALHAQLPHPHQNQESNNLGSSQGRKKNGVNNSQHMLSPMSGGGLGDADPNAGAAQSSRVRNMKRLGSHFLNKLKTSHSSQRLYNTLHCHYQQQYQNSNNNKKNNSTPANGLRSPWINDHAKEFGGTDLDKNQNSNNNRELTSPQPFQRLSHALPWVNSVRQLSSLQHAHSLVDSAGTNNNNLGSNPNSQPGDNERNNNNLSNGFPKFRKFTMSITPPATFNYKGMPTTTAANVPHTSKTTADTGAVAAAAAAARLSDYPWQLKPQHFLPSEYIANAVSTSINNNNNNNKGAIRRTLPNSTTSLETATTRSGPGGYRTKNNHSNEGGPPIATKLGSATNLSAYTATKEQEQIQHAIDTLLQHQHLLVLFVKTMMTYGAPLHHLNQNMDRMTKFLDLEASFFVLPGMAVISFDDSMTHTSETKVLQCQQEWDMYRLEQVNQIWKKVIYRDISVKMAVTQLEELIRAPDLYPWYYIWPIWGIMAWSISLLAFRGGWLDSACACGLGLLVGAMYLASKKFPGYTNFFEVSGAMVAGFGASLFQKWICFSSVALSATVVMFPGLIMTTGVIELTSRQLISGTVRIFYAFVLSFVIAFGLHLGNAIYTEIFSHGQVIPASVQMELCQGMSPYTLFLTVPVATTCIGMLIKVHWRHFLSINLVAGATFAIYWAIQVKLGIPSLAVTLSSFALGLISNTWSRLSGQAAYAILLPGQILLVPGSLGIRGIIALLEHDGGHSSLAFEMVIISISIMVGMFASTCIVYPFGKKRSALLTV